MPVARSVLSILVLACALTACKPPPPRTPQPEIAPAAPGGTFTPTAASSPVDMAVSSSAGDRDALQCDQQIGAAAAKHLSNRCLIVSPVAHPPCGVANTCDVIRGEIKRACDLMGPKDKRPKECTG